MKLFLNGSIIAALLSMSSHTDARIHVPQTRDLQASNLDITVFGTPTTITANQTEYDQNQNHEGAGYVQVTGGSAKLAGNMWRSFELPGDGVVVSADTVLSFDIAITDPFLADFTAICADENAVLGDGQRCWVVAAKEGEYIPDMYNVPNMVNDANPSKSFQIPIGKYFQGTVKYLALLQDNDTDEPSGGESTFSNIAFVADSPECLLVGINWNDVEIPDNQLVFDNGQQKDFDHKMEISSDDPSSITLIGNTWKAYELPEPLYFNESTTVEFEFGLIEETEVHTICFEKDLSVIREKNCFKLSGTQAFGIKVLKQSETGEVNHYKIPVGHFEQFLTGEIKYLGFGQDNDSADPTHGLCTFSGIQIYDEDRADLKVEVDGAMVTVPNSQIKYTNSEDSREHVLEVSADGLSATMTGNIFRSIALESPIEITKASQMEFDVELKNATDVKFLGFGLETDLSLNSFRTIFQLYGSRGNTITYPEDVEQGETKHYSLPVGIDMAANMTYLAFIQENDNFAALRKTGESTISNITIYERPDIMLKYGDEMVPVFNDQIIYDSNRQDFNKRNIWDVSADGMSITMHDNNWKYVKVPPYTIEEDTVLKFDFTLAEETEIHAICLEDDTEHDNGKRCFKVSGTQSVNNIFTVPGQTKLSDSSVPVTKSYAIRVGHFLAGIKMNYVVFAQDNDTPGRKGGESTYSNIHLFNAETCLLDDTSFSLSLDECSFSNILSGLEDQLGNKLSCSPNVWSELFGYFSEANYLYDIVDEVADICTSGYDMVSPNTFNQLSNEGYQFVEAFFDGDNKWNYEHDLLSDGVHSFDLAKEAGMISVMNGKMASEGISWPKLHNFEDCELRAAMCCWVAERTTGPAEPTDNSDVCYVDFTRAKRSSHVRDGYSIYNGITGAGDIEGAVNCHGFAWGNDAGYADNALKGNTLFNVAMQEGLYTNGLVEEVPGAPLCACAEQMPTVTTSDCTKINVDKTLIVSYDHTITAFVADVTINSIGYEPCGDLTSYYGDLVAAGKATAEEKAKLDEIIVGDGKCSNATSAFLATKGLTVA